MAGTEETNRTLNECLEQGGVFFEFPESLSFIPIEDKMSEVEAEREFRRDLYSLNSCHIDEEKRFWNCSCYYDAGEMKNIALRHKFSDHKCLDCNVCLVIYADKPRIEFL